MVKPRAISHVLLPRCRLAAAHIQELPGAGFHFDLFAPHHATCNCVQQIPKQREAPPCGLPKFGNLTAAKLLLSIYAVPGLVPFPARSRTNIIVGNYTHTTALLRLRRNLPSVGGIFRPISSL
jgi:hypothetical protein